MTCTLAEMADNLDHYWSLITPDIREAAEGWYPVAGQLAEEIGALAGGDKLTGAGIIAALSPRLQWTRNISAAREVALRPYLRPSGVFTSNWSKAYRIADGAAPSVVLSGNKVSRFYCNIMGNEDVATVDGHMYRAAAGKGVNMKHLERKGEYARVEAALIMGARRAGVPTTVYQAAIWLVIQAELRAEAAARRVAKRARNVRLTSQES